MDVFDLSAKLTLDSSQFNAGLAMAETAGRTFSGGIANVASVVAKAWGSALTASTGAVVAFGASAIKTGMEFDKAMSQVGATMGLTMSDMESQVGSVDLAWGKFSGNLREYAQVMGEHTAFSATQCAEALNYMALAGYDTQKSMDMLPNVLNLASAGSMDLARASDMVTDAQTAFGLTAERTTQMVDEMAKASSTGNTSVEQLGDAFLTVGGLAKELNGGMVTLADGTSQSVDGIQELEIALTAMANAGVKGSEAGTHMRNMLLKLSSPTSEGTKQLEKLGVSVFDTEGNMRSLKDIMGDLDGALGNLTQEEKIQAISDLFNTRDMASAEALLGAVGQDWDKIGESILDAEGSAQKMAETKLDNLQGDVTLFKSALEGAQIAMSDGLTPTLRDFVQTGTKGIDEISQAFKSGDFMGAVESAGKLFTDMLAKVVEQAPKAVEAGSKLLQSIIKGIASNAPKIAKSASEIVVTYVRSFFESLPTIFQAGITLIVEFVKGISQALPDLIPAMVQGIVDMIKVITDPANIDAIINAGVALINGLVDGLINAMPIIEESLPQIIEGILRLLFELAPKLAEAGIEIIGHLAMSLVDNLPMILEKIPDMVMGIIQAFIDSSDRMREASKELLAKFGINFKEGWEDFKLQVSSFVDGLVNKFLEIAGRIKDVAVRYVSNLVNAFTEMWNAFVNGGIQGLVALLVQKFLSFVATVGEIGGRFVGAIKDKIVSMWESVKSAVPALINALVTAFTNLVSNFLSIGKDIVSSILAGITGTWDTLKKSATSLITNLPKAIGNVSGLFTSIGVNIIKGISQGITNSFKGLKDNLMAKIKALPESARKFLGIKSPSRLFRDEVGQWIPKGIAVGIDEGMGALDEAMSSMMDAVEPDYEPSIASVDGIYNEGNNYGGVGLGMTTGINQTFNIYDKQQSPDELARAIRLESRYGLIGGVALG